MSSSVSSAAAPMIVAHRGASYDAPENTLAAFKLAWELGADGVEGDFYLTKDNHIVCIHDKDTKRTAGENLVVEEATLEELRKLDAGTWKDKKFAGEKIPTFEEVIACVPAGKLFVIELKSKKKIVDPLVAALKKANRTNIAYWIITFDEETAQECKQKLPDMKVHWLTSFKQPATTEGAIEASNFRPTATEVAKTVKRAGVDGVGINGSHEAVTGPFLQELVAGGCKEFHAWTIDDPQRAIFLRGHGPVGITTNRPDVIRQTLTTSR